ncbi:MAG: hypothetical protein IKC03_09760 [Oscillospiraceae bacterium]|nr:hypothetical protein [Oscillospiraceae bacterium]
MTDNLNKSKHAFWLTPEAKTKVETTYQLAQCKSQSEFVEHAIRFYSAYICADHAGDFLPAAIAQVIEGKHNIMMKQLGRMLFKHAVETNITNHLIAADTDLSQQTYEHLRNRSVREVRETNGEITFLDDLKFQKGW